MKTPLNDDDLDPRRRLLADASQDLGKRWAEGWFEELRREGRRVTGGWPGTMSESRGRTRAYVDALLTKRAMQPVTQGELADAARGTYDIARALWLGSRVRDEAVQ